MFCRQIQEQENKKKSKRIGLRNTCSRSLGSRGVFSKTNETKTACHNVPVSRNGAEPAPGRLSHYIITLHVAYFVAYTLDDHSSTHRCILHKHCKCKSLCAWNFLSCLTCILLKRKFIPQASRQCQRALDPNTDWPTRCHCLFVACLHLKCYCDSDSTKVATIQQPRRWPKRSSPLHDPRKRLWIFFFLLNQPLPAVWALETWWQHSAMSAGAG